MLFLLIYTYECRSLTIFDLKNTYIRKDKAVQNEDL